MKDITLESKARRTVEELIEEIERLESELESAVAENDDLKDQITALEQSLEEARNE